MAQITVAGPFQEQAARDTARALGESNHSVYSKALVGADGFETGESDWFVERDTQAVATKIFGYAWAEIQARQQRSR